MIIYENRIVVVTFNKLVKLVSRKKEEIFHLVEMK